jgi:cytochrome c556
MRYGAVLWGALAFGLLSGAAPQDPKDIKAVMGVAHKGKDSLLEKIKGGKATDDDKKKLLSLYEALAKFKPPMGDEKSWTDKTAALVAAAKDLVDKKDGAMDKLKTASDCKACHTLHKPK